MSKIDTLVPSEKEILEAIKSSPQLLISDMDKVGLAKLGQMFTKDEAGWTGSDGTFFEKNTGISTLLDSLQVEIVGYREESQSPRAPYSQDLNSSRRAGF